jgi:hypothetical protein
MPGPLRWVEVASGSRTPAGVSLFPRAWFRDLHGRIQASDPSLVPVTKICKGTLPRWSSTHWSTWSTVGRAGTWGLRRSSWSPPFRLDGMEWNAHRRKPPGARARERERDASSDHPTHRGETINKNHTNWGHTPHRTETQPRLPNQQHLVTIWASDARKCRQRRGPVSPFYFYFKSFHICPAVFTPLLPSPAHVCRVCGVWCVVCIWCNAAVVPPCARLLVCCLPAEMIAEYLMHRTQSSPGLPGPWMDSHRFLASVEKVCSLSIFFWRREWGEVERTWTDPVLPLHVGQGL